MSHAAPTGLDIAGLANFIRSFKHFNPVGNQSQKSILEMAIGRALDDTTLSGAAPRVYDPVHRVVGSTQKTATKLGEEGYELDHVFERQFIAGLALEVCAKAGINPPLTFLNDLLTIANCPGNLVWIPKAFHTAKTNFFGKKSDVLGDEIFAYLKACQPGLKDNLVHLAQTASDGSAEKVLIMVMGNTAFVKDGAWDHIKGELWLE
ncbi:hypothetical protein FRB94_004943 [Tulasnella sp. JGI-2019a]|nr:hypothetical protein FRB93_001502 [Tulasnella sp. JGI-2019a]KAG9001050.1 hypothetical protein FRB94_004943 [Tulasnella sp. JGI-2019a]KAG9033276.1 hypothetical protein FRB95_000370 [Tulasnella sp. JGI-2019a]